MYTRNMKHPCGLEGSSVTISRDQEAYPNSISGDSVCSPSESISMDMNRVIPTVHDPLFDRVPEIPKAIMGDTAHLLFSGDETGFPYMTNGGHNYPPGSVNSPMANGQNGHLSESVNRLPSDIKSFCMAPLPVNETAECWITRIKSLFAPTTYTVSTKNGAVLMVARSEPFRARGAYLSIFAGMSGSNVCFAIYDPHLRL